jgi:NADH-quinone oxidoreductase subunit J
MSTAATMAANATLAASGGEMGTGEAITFWILGPISLLGAIGMVLARNAVHSALFLVTTMFSLGVFYILQGGPFIGMAQIIVYTGAIMILFLFVLMLVGRDSSDSVVETIRGQRVAAFFLGLGFAVLIATGLWRALDGTKAVGLDTANAKGNVQGIAAKLFTQYVFAFEVTSALLITAAMGAMVLAHVERAKGDKRTQRDRSRERFSAGNYPAPKPGPGVLATSHSVATPALLPTGEVAPGSVPDIVEPAALELAAASDEAGNDSDSVRTP